MMPPLEMGTLLKDRFRLLRPLGEGGMGEVYLGEDERGGLSEGRPVAIKALRTELNEKEELFSRRFREEIEILRRLNEPGIPAFVDAFEEGDRSFFVMEYVEGHSLESLLDRSPLGLRPDMVAEVGVQVLKILEHLHNQTPPLIHRDLKPANLIIRRQDDLVFLVDFGLAREFHTSAAARTLVGTVGYCPLEQLQGNPEPRSDLYALGATLFELLTGQIPKPLAIPPVRTVQPDVPEKFARLVDKSVKQNVEERFQSAAEMRLALEDVRQSMRPSPPKPQKNKKTGSDRADQLLTTWGRSMAEAAMLTNPIPKPRRWPQLLAVLAAIGLVYGVYQYRGRQHYQAEQRDLVKDALKHGRVPGSGWNISDAHGLFPADGLGLGRPDRDWDKPTVRTSALFSSKEARATKDLIFKMRRLKGDPKVLAFSCPWGVLLEPASKGGYEMRIVRVAETISAQDIAISGYKGVQPFRLGNWNSIEVKVSLSGRTAQLVVDGKQRRKFAMTEAWKGKKSGVMLLNGADNSRCVVTSFQLR